MSDPRPDPDANDGHAKCRDETRLARDLAGHRIRDIHDCFLMNCRDLGDEVRSLYERLAERDALAAVAEPYTGRIEAFDAVLAFLTEMPDADGLVERGDLQDYVTDLRSRATAARTVAK